VHDSTNEGLEALRADREARIVHVRSVLNTYDETYLDSVVELDKVERDLARVREAKKALELARDTFSRLSQDTYVHWASKLNATAKALLEKVELDYENLEFGQDLTVSVARKGSPERLEPAQMESQLSVGTKEQLNWLARLVVCRFLSVDNSMPIIADEILREADDLRFTRLFQFLLDVVVKENQIIMFSSHQMRYRSLIDGLNPEQKQLIEICKKSSLRADSVKT
jgi:hypothetical protein